MASLLHSTLFSCFLLLVIFLSTTTLAQPSLRPKGLILQVTKDTSTRQYLTTIKQRTPLVPLKLVLDLGGQFQWVDCDSGYISSTYLPPRCGSAICSLARSDGCGSCFSAPKPGCNNNTCGVTPDNSVAGVATSGEIAQDVLVVPSTDGLNPGVEVTVPRFVFGCGATFLLKGLASGTVGMAGLGRTNIALPSQFASAFSFKRKFAVCLSSGNGVVIFGDGPYIFLPRIDVSQGLTFTPLLINPVSTASAFAMGEKSAEYFIGVSSIKINDKPIPLNETLLKINSQGFGGTKISTVDPYTVMESSIYKAVTETFVVEAAAMNIKRVAAVAPFGACFSNKNVASTRLGFAVPEINLVLQSSNVVWRIFGANSMVSVGSGVMCLGFVDGGKDPRTSIVIGGYQQEDHLLQFDLATSRLGFTSTLLGRQTTCSNFNFTSNA